jgi:hypothetical protein
MARLHVATRGRFEVRGESWGELAHFLLCESPSFFALLQTTAYCREDLFFSEQVGRARSQYRNGQAHTPIEACAAITVTVTGGV